MSALMARNVIAEWSRGEQKEMVEQISRTIALANHNDNRVTVALVLNAIGDVYGHPDEKRPFRTESSGGHVATRTSAPPQKTVGGIILDAVSRWLVSKFRGNS